MLSTSYKFLKKDTPCNRADTKEICILLPFPSDHFYIYIIKTFIDVAGAAFILCVTFQ